MKRLLATTALILAAGGAIAEPTAAPPRPVVTEIIAQDYAQERSFSGVVTARDTVRLAFQTSGRVASLRVEPGDRVTKGDVLATLDQITLEQDLQAAKAAVDAAEAQAVLAAQQFERVAQLSARGVASARQVEQAEANRDATAAQADSARAVLAKAEDAARYGTLSAPRDGVVLSTAVEQGTLVNAGTPILDLADLSVREAVVDVPEQFVDLLPEGSRFTVQYHAAGVAPIQARLRLIEPVADTALETRRIRLQLIEPGPDYRIGSLISASYSNENNVLVTVPEMAVQLSDGQAQVWRIDPGARVVHAVPVTLGQAVGARVIVLDGLAPGDEIVTRGVGALSEGQIVGDRYQ